MRQVCMKESSWHLGQATPQQYSRALPILVTWLPGRVTFVYISAHI